MAIAFDAQSNPSSYGQNNSWTHTVGELTNGIAVVAVACHSFDSAPSTVTFDGNSMTLVEDYSGSYRRVLFYYYLNPGSGSKTVVVNFGSSPLYTPKMTTLTYEGVSQSSPIRTQSGFNGTASGTVSNSCTSETGDVVLDALCMYTSTGMTFAVGADQTSRYEAGPSTSVSLAVSSENGAGTTTMSWGYSGALDGNYAQYLISLRNTYKTCSIQESFSLNDTTIETGISGLSESFSVNDEASAQSLIATISEQFSLNDTGSALAPELLSESFSVGESHELNEQSISWMVPVSLNAYGRHITLKFQNNSVDVGLYLRDVLVYADSSEDPTNITQVNASGEHVSLKFQNNTADATMYLEYVVVDYDTNRP